MTTVLNALLVVGGLASSLVLSATEGGAQPAPGTFPLGFLSPSSAAEPRAQQFLNAFRQGLRARLCRGPEHRHRSQVGGRKVRPASRPRRGAGASQPGDLPVEQPTKFRAD